MGRRRELVAFRLITGLGVGGCCESVGPYIPQCRVGGVPNGGGLSPEKAPFVLRRYCAGGPRSLHTPTPPGPRHFVNWKRGPVRIYVVTVYVTVRDDVSGFCHGGKEATTSHARSQQTIN